MRGYPLFSFRILITLAKIYFSPIVITFAKHTSVLGGTALKEAEIPKWGGGGGGVVGYSGFQVTGRCKWEHKTKKKKTVDLKRNPKKSLGPKRNPENLILNF